MRYFLFFLILCSHPAFAQETDIIKADKEALKEAKLSGFSSKIIAAKEQLSDDLFKEAEMKRKDEEGVVIPLTSDGQGHLLADVLINNRIQASLVVDTGSPVLMLTHSFAKQLGLDISHVAVGYVEVLSGRYKAARVLLNSVKVGDLQAKNVGATVLLEDSKEIKNGLLGLSFLSKFHFTLDEKGQRLVFKKVSIFSGISPETLEVIAQKRGAEAVINAKTKIFHCDLFF